MCSMPQASNQHPPAIKLRRCVIVNQGSSTLKVAAHLTLAEYKFYAILKHDNENKTKEEKGE